LTGRAAIVRQDRTVTLENTTSALSHLAFCALAALGLARQDGVAGTPYAENLFLIRWLGFYAGTAEISDPWL